jgi:enoyl-CoA hydratase/carnithine racemase
MPLTGPEILLYEQAGPVVTITLNRPERLNAISIELRRRLAEAFRRFDADTEARVAILTGAGERAFSAGADLREMSEQAIGAFAGGRAESTGRYGSQTWKPTIAAVNGLALANGWMLAQDCDIRIAAEHAEFAITEAKWSRGSAYAVPLLWMLPLGVGLEVLFTGERFTARRLYELGFVNRVVPAAELMPAARGLAETIAENAPLTIRAQKESMYRAMDLGRQNGLLYADQLFRGVYQSEDALEGPRAFAEKRKPVWKGR